MCLQACLFQLGVETGVKRLAVKGTVSRKEKDFGGNNSHAVLCFQFANQQEIVFLWFYQHWQVSDGTRFHN